MAASLYNMEVGPYFLNQRIKKETKNIGTGNLVSGVWNYPASLERPVNRDALRVVGYSKDVSGPAKK